MVSRFEIIDEEYIEKLKDKCENENTKNGTEWWNKRFQKVGEWKKLASEFRRVQERCPRPTTVAVLGIQKFSNFALYAINKESQWILVKLRINITCVFTCCWNCPSRAAKTCVILILNFTRSHAITLYEAGDVFQLQLKGGSIWTSLYLHIQFLRTEMVKYWIIVVMKRCTFGRWHFMDHQHDLNVRKRPIEPN